MFFPKDNSDKEAVKHARKIKKEFARRFTENYVAEKERVLAIFMAGSPGAGKTEFSKHLLSIIDPEHKILRIDPDEFRFEFENYSGYNADKFQYPVSILTDAVMDRVFKKNLNFLLDGTFAHTKALANLDRSVKHSRIIHIVYLHHEPNSAWEFVQNREKLDNRKIEKGVFKKQYVAAYKNVLNAKKLFKDSVKVLLVTRDLKRGRGYFIKNADLERLQALDIGEI